MDKACLVQYAGIIKMNSDTIEIRIYDESHTKVFQAKARIEKRKEMDMLRELLTQKGISLEAKKKKSDFF